MIEANKIEKFQTFFRPILILILKFWSKLIHWIDPRNGTDADRDNLMWAQCPIQDESQFYDHELQRQRCKNSQNSQKNCDKIFSFTLKNALALAVQRS
jgi:hypothetical protein